MRDVAADIAAVLEAAGLGLTTGTNLWIGQMVPEDDPNTPDLAVAVLQTGGGEPESFVGGSRRVVLSPSCQVRIRGNREAYQESKQLALACASALNEIKVPPYIRIHLTESSPFFVGMDGSDRPQWTFNVEAQYVDDGSTPPELTLPGARHLDASRVDVSAISGLTADNAQAALAEHQGDIEALQAADATEAQARADADTALQTSIDTEAASRADADDLLDGRVSANESDIESLQTDLAAEQTARAGADTALDGRVTQNEGDIASLLTQIANAVLKSGDQSIDGVKTFLAKAILAAGAELQDAISFSGIAAGNPAVDLPEDVTVRAAKSLVFEQVGDAFGTVKMTIRSRSGHNGVLFESLALDVVDFMFKAPTASRTRYIRLENRSGSGKAGTPSLHIGGSLPDNPTLAVGDQLVQVRGTSGLELTTSGAGVYLRSANGTRYLLTVANDGTLVTTPL